MIRVVKLGGSLLAAETLPACLIAAKQLSASVLLVPGGGPFADQVRSAQQRWAFDDAVAHRMAILAMQQMALFINGLEPAFALCDTGGAVEGPPRLAVWLPHYRELDAAGVEAGWNVTSDSLAAWLAAEIGASELLLVKSARVEPGADWRALQAQGIVDEAFGRFAARLHCPITVIDKERFCQSYDSFR